MLLVEDKLTRKAIEAIRSMLSNEITHHESQQHYESLVELLTQ